MTKKKQMWIAVLSAAALLCACVCGALPVAADDDAETVKWQETEDGQFLYRPRTYRYEDCVEVMYIGDGTDVTVPASFGGEAFDVIWFTDRSAIDFGRSDSEQAQTWHAKVDAASDRYLNLTFEEGPTGVEVTPGMWPGYVRAASVNLPKSVTGVTLCVQGLTAVSVPEGSALTGVSLYNVLERWENPQPAVIDLTGATGLQRVWIGRDEHADDCFIKGSVIKLPTEFKDVQIQREYPKRSYEGPYFFIDYAPMSLTIQYADGTERPANYPGDVTQDDSLDMKDVLTIRQVIARMSYLQDPTIADFNGDGDVNMKDVLLIRRVIATGIPES